MRDSVLAVTVPFYISRIGFKYMSNSLQYQSVDFENHLLQQNCDFRLTANPLITLTYWLANMQGHHHNF